MARKSNLIGTTETGNLSALGNAQQRDFNFVKSLLNRDDLIRYFAEPSVQENQERIDWYSDAHGKIIGFSEFNSQQIRTARDELNHLIRELSLAASKAENQFDRQAIENLSVLPDQDSIKLVGDQVTIINWAYKLHKRSKGDRQSTNFAGFADLNTDAEHETEETVDESKSSETEVPLSDTQREEKSNRISEENHPSNSLVDQKDESQREVQNKLSRFPIIRRSWIWLLLFFVLLVLNLLLLKDACGVKGLPFLYFC